MNELRAAEVLGTGLRRAIDPVVVALALGTAIVTVGLTAVLHLGSDPTDATTHPFTHLLVTQLRTLVTLAPSAAGSAAMVLVVVARERGERPALGVLLARFHLVYFGQLCASFAVGAGVALLVLPAIWIGTVVSIVTPVTAEEGVGPLTAFRRCRELIEGRFDVVGAVVVTAWLLMAGVIALCGAPFVSEHGIAGTIRALNAMDDPAVALALGIARTVYGALWAGITGVLYVRLRQRELPSDAEKLANVFA